MKRLNRKRICAYNELDQLSGYALVEKCEDSLKLLWISVFGRERRRGIGSHLIELVKEYARSSGCCRICGYIDLNPEGFLSRKRFFERHGRVFVQNGVLAFTIPV